MSSEGAHLPATQAKPAAPGLTAALALLRVVGSTTVLCKRSRSIALRAIWRTRHNHNGNHFSGIQELALTWTVGPRRRPDFLRISPAFFPRRALRPSFPQHAFRPSRFELQTAAKSRPATAQ